ncbi:hypothetical protein [Caenimonas aquaedulcis]|uniref:Uncharacterized protein n=1 Tax=Caenimonas aquaedulcis TaxID=2793270 RepID=A0A931H174_9BURK|nr:hypothetical protein [Caenimonas aquaedulcis]MBG9386682.1 hypothetical protein [Caenimonas aquaedulcis]
MKKFFGAGNTEAATQFHESESTAEDTDSSNTGRREMVHVVLRDIMRKHGIPSDWLECRVLSGQTRQQRPGMHVQFIVLNGEEQLLGYIHAFQDSFWRELERYDSRARDWLFSVAWQFEGPAKDGMGKMPVFRGWDEEAQSPDTQPSELDTRPPEGHEDELKSDLEQLFAIRDAALSEPPPAAHAPPAKPRP